MPTKTITGIDGVETVVDPETGEIMSTADKPETGLVPAEDGSLVPIPAELAAMYDGMIASVPEAGGDGLVNILTQILAAQDATELDAPWRTDKLVRLAGAPLVVTALRRAPSDYDGGLAFFLIVDATIRATGERVTFTTGAVSVVAQLAKAWALGAMPITVIPRRAERPNARGYYAWHLEVVR